MKERIRKFFKVFLVITAIVLVVSLVFGIVLVLAWPWWVGCFLLLFLAGLGLACFFLRRMWRKRREESFVSDMVEQDDARIRALAVKDKSELKDLQDRWKAAIGKLRKSHLKKLGNPLYVLPWYMVIGDSGSGKTTSLNSARLSSPFADFGKVRGISGTKQCDWYFFEQAIVIDTAGRYTIPLNGDRDKDEWQKFLSLLIKYRRREPLNGLIIAVAADRLLNGQPEDLEKDAQAIRRRVDELMRALGVRFPVYALVTKCDLINGINRFCEILPEKSLSQPMGVVNQDLSSDVDSFLERAVTTIDERLRNLRLHLLHEPRGKSADPALLLFPEEFERLKQGLSVFMATVFRRNPYQETPVLRGLFFGSGRQEGTPQSRFSEAVSGPAKEESLPGTSKGLFLHDFFASILPRDRDLLAPTRRALEWRALTENVGLVSWIIVSVAVCGLLSFSFVKNMATIRDISQEFSSPATLKGDSLANLAAMDRFRGEIVRIEEQNRHWWIPRFGLDESIKIEKELKKKYCREFHKFLLIPFDQQMTESITNLSVTTPDEVYGQYVVHVVRRINILKARMEDSDMEGLLAKPQPSYLSFINSSDPALTVEAKKVFGSLYLSYLIWRTDSGEAAKEMAELQTWLNQIVAAKGGDLRWMATWVGSQGNVSAVTLKEFWGGSLTTVDERSIPPSFTRKGKTAIDSLLAELESAMADQRVIAAPKADFYEWYRKSAIASWREFASSFSQGIERLQGAREWQTAAAGMAGDKGPYFSLLNRIAFELEPLATKGSIPSWLQQVYWYQSARAQKLAQDAGALAQKTSGGGRIVSAIRRNIGREAAAQEMNERMKAGKRCRNYRAALVAITPAVASRRSAFQLASQTFSEDHATSSSHFHSASLAIEKIKSEVPGDASDAVFLQLFRGPLDFLWTYVRRESACHLQSLWEEQVLAPTMGMTPQQAMPVLLGPDGLVWRFAKGPAAPFLKSSGYGYGAKEVLGGTISLQNSLFTFLGKGGRAQATIMSMGSPRNFSVGVKGLPTDTNAEASFKPHATRLELQCGGSVQALVNNNYPVSKTFTWSPGSCGDVVLQIEVGDVVLTKHYLGEDGLPSFLKDMRRGRRTFKTGDFPGEKDALRKMGIKYITVNYRFVGSGAILRQKATLSGQAPRSITQCWAQ